MAEFIAKNWPALIGAIVALVSLWYVRKSTLAAVTSASASETSAQTAEDALAEARRQHLADIRPHLTMEIRGIQGRIQMRYEFVLTNTGSGSAQNVNASFYARLRPGSGVAASATEPMRMERRISSLGASQIELLHESPRPVNELRGVITCQDVESNHYWFRRKGFSDGWEWGEGEPPKPEQTDQDA